MASLRGHTNPGHPFCAADIFHAPTVRGRTKWNANARLRPTPQSKRPYPELSYLAHAVIHRAIKDAQPELEFGGKPRKASVQMRRCQCESLIWLCSVDPELCYWAMLADYPLSGIHAKFRPLLRHFVAQHPTIAGSFNLPEWCRG